METFPERLNRLMQDRGMKQADLCRKSGISTSLMSNYFTGKASPKISKATAIADALGVSLDELSGISDITPDAIDKPALTDLERRLLTAFRGLNSSVQKLAIQLIENLNPDGDKTKNCQCDCSERMEKSA